MTNHHLVCKKCREETFLGQGYGLIQLRGFVPAELFTFITEHYEHGIEIWDDNMVMDMDEILDRED